MFQRVLTALCALLLVCALSGGGSAGRLTAFAQSFGVSPPAGTAVSQSFDSHGGFHGDGASLTVFAPPDIARAAFAAALDEAGWSVLPLDDAAQALLGSWLADRSEPEAEALLEIQNGRYRLLDRFAEGNPDSRAQPWYERAAVNLSLAVYDTEQGLLYLCECRTGKQCASKRRSASSIFAGALRERRANGAIRKKHSCFCMNAFLAIRTLEMSPYRI